MDVFFNSFMIKHYLDGHIITFSHFFFAQGTPFDVVHACLKLYRRLGLVSHRL